jgi:hypothetical protein
MSGPSAHNTMARGLTLMAIMLWVRNRKVNGDEDSTLLKLFSFYFWVFGLF